jgi:hypothetical protein
MAYAEHQASRWLALCLLAVCAGCSDLVDIEVKRRPTEVTQPPPQSKRIPLLELPPPEPMLLASAAVADGTGPGHLALDETHVYWSEQASRQLRRIHKDGGEAVTLLTASPDSSPEQIALQGDAYFVVYDAIEPSLGWIGKIAATDDAVVELVGGLDGGAETIAVRDNDVVWGARWGDNALMRTTTVAGGSVTLVLESVDSACCNRNSVVIDETWIYFADALGGRVGRVGRQSAELEILAQMNTPNALSIDAEAVYWSGAASLWRYDKVAATQTKLASVAAGQTAVDDTHLYFTVFSNESSGFLGRVSKDGSGTVEILVGAINGLFDVAVDDEAIFFSTQFATNDGTFERGIYKLAK